MRGLHLVVLGTCYWLLFLGATSARSGPLSPGPGYERWPPLDREPGRHLLESEAADLGGVRDAQALLVFKTAVMDDPYGVMDSWDLKLNPNVCDWGRAVRCTDSGRVRGLRLQGAQLSGTIPPAIGRLDRLVTLDLSQNFLSGGIPKQLGSLQRLESLVLGQNRLTGGIPAELGQLANLRVLDLSFNNFTGTSIPASLGNLSSLVDLFLNNTDLEGNIPRELIVVGSLDILDLQYNRLSGPIPPESTNFNGSKLILGHNRLNGSIPPLENMANIKHLDLSYNPLTGSLPPSLTMLNATLDTLEIAHTSISGQIPKVYGQLFSEGESSYSYSYNGYVLQDDHATILILAGNQLSGDIPEELADLVDVAHLDLSGNALTGSIPESFGRMKTITNLLLSNNELSGPIPDVFANLTLLEAIDLSSNYFTGPIPPSLGKKKDCTLRQVILHNNLLTGSIPPDIATCPSLVELSLQSNRLSGTIPNIGDSLVEILKLNQNRFTGQIPSSLGTLTYLTYMDLSENLFAGSMPASFTSLPNATYINLSRNKLNLPLPEVSSISPGPIVALDLSGNRIPGPIPSSIANLKEYLTTLRLDKNRLSGELPPELGSLTSLRTLGIANNRLTGSIPPHLGNLTGLSSLQLQKNMLTGGIPSSLGYSPQLVELDLSRNALNASIPASLGNLSALESLLLSHNQLSGPIPYELGTLFRLTELDLSFNRLSGPIPPSLSSLSALEAFNLSANRLSGIVPAGNLTRFGASSYLSNADLCGGPLPPCPSPPPGPGTGGEALSGGAIAGIATGGLAALLIFSVLLAVLMCCWRKSYEEDEGEFSLFQKMGAPFNMRIILEATDNFNPKKILGEGGFGAVYKVTLKDGTDIAVKRLKDGTSQGLLEVKAEMQTLGKIKHRNLVQLYGAYIGKRESLLFYEFLPGGDLDGYLYEQKKSKPFREWAQRHSALLGAARGLKYLHHEAPLTIIHRDIKPPNILFGSDLTAKVADFGLAKEIDMSEKTHLSTTVSGTIGYLAPEYATSGKLTTKSDVFAYGIVLMQVMTGKRPGEESLGDFGLAKWVHKTWKEAGLKEVLDPHLTVEKHEEMQVVGALRLGLMCTSKFAGNRPTMDEVVYLLENLDIFEEDPDAMGPLRTASDVATLGGSVGLSSHRSGVSLLSGAMSDSSTFRSGSGGFSVGSVGFTMAHRSPVPIERSDSIASLAPIQRSQQAI